MHECFNQLQNPLKLGVSQSPVASSQSAIRCASRSYDKWPCAKSNLKPGENLLKMAELAHRKRGQTDFFSGNVNIPSGFWTGKSIYICLFCLQINTKTRTLIPPFPDCAFQKRYGLAWEPSSSIIILTALSSHFLIGGRYTGRLLGKLPFTRTFSGWSHFHTFISQYFLLAKRNHDQQEKHTIHIQNFVLHEMTLNGGIYIYTVYIYKCFLPCQAWPNKGDHIISIAFDLRCSLLCQSMSC